jgi:RNA-directed DNA polymerase
MSVYLISDPKVLRSQFLSLKTRNDIAALLEVEASTFSYYLYAVPECEHYRTFAIRKNLGGIREISAPITSIKILQKKLNQVLQVVYTPRDTVHSYVRGTKRNILTNAKSHLNRKLILNVDLRNFFPSINFGRVQGLFMNSPYDLNYIVSTTLAKLCCFNRALPQGAPTSPIVSNMICSKLDRQLSKLARDHDCSYTRYADDITFSTAEDEFPETIQTMNNGKIEIGKQLMEFITSNGFEINPDKIKLRTRAERQVVTGVVINSFPNVRREYVRKIRAMLHAWRKFGLDGAETEFRAKHDRKQRGEFKYPVSFKFAVKGKIEYIRMIKGKNDPIYLRLRNELRTLAPELVKSREAPMEFLMRTSRATPANSVIASVRSKQGDANTISRLLAAVDPGLETKRLGVWQTFDGNSADRLRQAAHSMREVIRLLLDRLAPDKAIMAASWYIPPKDSGKNPITRKMRVRYCLSGASKSSSTSVLTFIESVASFVDESYARLSTEAHADKESDVATVKAFLESGEIVILMILLKRTT